MSRGDGGGDGLGRCGCSSSAFVASMSAGESGGGAAATGGGTSAAAVPLGAPAGADGGRR